MLARVADQRVLRGAPAILRAVLVDQEGEPTTPVGTLTLTVTRLDGTVLKSGVATQAATGHYAQTGAYEITTALTAAETGAGLDVLTCQWIDGTTTRMTTLVEVCGGHYFSPSELGGARGLASDSGVGLPDLVRLRHAVEDQIEWSTGVAWVPRTELRSFDLDGYPVVLQGPVRSLRSVTLDDEALDVSEFDVDELGVLRWSGRSMAGWASGTLAVRWDHGYDRPPERLRRAGIEAARYLSLGERVDGADPRAVSITNEYGNVQFARTDRDRPFGLPDVDGVVKAYSRRGPWAA